MNKDKDITYKTWAMMKSRCSNPRHTRVSQAEKHYAVLRRKRLTEAGFDVDILNAEIIREIYKKAFGALLTVESCELIKTEK
jgi:hypothetical protein